MEVVYLSMPADDWDVIVSGIESVCEKSASEIAVLRNVKVMWRGTPED